MLYIKNIITEMKNAFDGFMSTFDTAKKKKKSVSLEMGL